jgi:DegV family protein with EDD domain
MRGGRIGKARGWIGKLLGIKPILGLQEGEIVPVDRARGGQAAQDRLLELLAQRLAPRRPAIAAVIHAKAPARADRVSRLLRERFAVRELLVAELGPVLGTQVGPGMVGVVAFQPTDDEAELLAPLTPAAGGG